MDVDKINMIIKTLFVHTFSLLIFFKITNYKDFNYLKRIASSILIVILTIFNVILRQYLDNMATTIILYVLQVFIIKIITNLKLSNILISTIISISISYFTFMVAGAIEFFIQRGFYIVNKIVNIVLTVIIQLIILLFLSKIKRFKNGFLFLQKLEGNDYIDMIMINISSVVILAYYLFGNYYGDDLTMHIFISLMLVGIIMIVIIQKTLTMYYKQKLLDDTIKQYEKELKEKDAKIEELSNEKFKISKINHEFFNRQEALELKVQELSSMKMETAEELEVTNRIQSLTKEYSNLMHSIKSMPQLPKTDIPEIDDMFKYMQAECYKNNIDFKLQINGNIHHLINNYITKSKLETLIGDHIRDAIIAVSSSDNENKSILAILGIKNNFYEFCVYDTGIDFEIDTLIKLGLESVTTHKETGGSGIGFITTFETMKECKASLIIEEQAKDNKNDYTKSVTIRFDGKNEYRIISYRANEIKKKTKDNRIIIEEI